MSRKRIFFTATCVSGIAAAASSFVLITSSGTAASVDAAPAAGEIAALNTTRVAADALPQDLANWASELGTSASGLPASEQPGTPLMDESRLLLEGQGTSQAALYVVPTSSGEACYLLSLGPATCVDSFSGTTAVGWTVLDPDIVGSGTSAMVFGIAPDRVSEVDVVVDGISHTATLKDNGFFYQLQSSSALPSAITAIKVAYADGTSTTISPNLQDPDPAQTAG